MSRAGRYALLGLIGGAVGFGLDYVHVASGVLAYENPHLAGTSLWVLPLFAIVTIVSAVLVQALARRLPPPRITWARAIADLAALIAGHFIDALLPGRNILVLAILGILAAIIVLSRPTRFIFAITAAAGVLAPLGEMLISQAGFFRYAYGDPIVPLWLPVLWMIGAAAIADFTLLLVPPPGEASIGTQRSNLRA